MPERQPLTIPRIVKTAAALADRSGLGAVSMRRIGRELGVEGMAIYHHIPSKEALLDLLTEWVYTQIRLPPEVPPWREAIRTHALSLHAVLTAHPWALSLVDSRSAPGPATLRRLESVIRCLRQGGFSPAQITPAMSLLDAYVYGFALTERNLPFDPATGAGDFTATVALDAAAYPELRRCIQALMQDDGTYDFSAEFPRGLDTLLEAIERRREANG